MVGLLYGRKLSGAWNAYVYFALFALLSITNPAQAQNQTIGAGLEGQALIDYLQQNYTPAQTLGYDNARDIMYGIIDNVNGNVSGVYTGYTITLDPNADPSTDAYNKGINAEHTWPQSMGAGVEPQRSDLHHLFPTKSNVNSARNNDPLGEIDDNLTDTWYYLDQSQSSIPTNNIDLYAENYGSTAFEPREQHKGNAARAVFYFNAIYQSAATQSFFELQKDDLYQWHYADPVDAAELARSSSIAGYQGNENPFILDTSLVRRAFFPDGNTGTPDTTPPVISSVQAGNIGSNSATITWITDESSSSLVDYGLTTGYGSSQSTSGATTSHSVLLTGLSANTTYFYQVSSTDGSGNNSSSGGYSFTTTQTGTGGTGTVVFSEIFYDTPGTDSDEEWIELYNGGSGSLDLAGYTITDNNGTGSSYTFPAGSVIGAGSYFVVASNEAGFTAIYGIAASQYGSIPALNNSGDALILTDGSGAEVDAVAWEGGASSGVPTGWGNGPTAATGESIYRSPVTTDTDTGADWAVAPNNGDPANIPAADVTSPVITSIASSSITETEATITWTTDEAATSVVNYGPTAALGSVESGTGSVTSHSVTLTGLTPGTEYFFKVESADQSGNVSTSSQTSFTTVTPAIAEVLFSEIFYDTPGTETDEEWLEVYNTTASNLDISGYTIVDNNGTGASYTFPSGSVIAPNDYFTIARTALGFQALYAADAHQYGSLPALNNSGESLLLLDDTGSTIDQVAWEGGASAGVPAGWGTGPTAAEGESIVRVSLTTDTDTDADWTTAPNNGDPASLPLADVTAPVISAVVSSGITETEATITWTTDEASSTQVNYGTTTSYGSSVSGSGLVTSHSITISGLTAGTQYYYQVVSTDDVGNTGVDEPYTFTTDSPPVSTTADILFSEIFYDTPGNESNEEWIEIYNTTSAEITLNGWTITDNNGTGSTFTFSNKHKIAGNSYLTLASHRRSFRNMYGKNADDYVSLPALNNAGETLILKDDSGNEIDAVTWEGGASAGIATGWGSTSLPVAGEGFTIYRTSLSTDTDTYADWDTSTDLGSPTTQSDGTFAAKVKGDITSEEADEIPTEITLSNYPNPFNPTTQIQFTLPEAQNVRVSVFNMLGQEVAVLAEGSKDAGTHTVQFNATAFSSGIYLYRIQTQATVITNKMMLIK